MDTTSLAYTSASVYCQQQYTDRYSYYKEHLDEPYVNSTPCNMVLKTEHQNRLDCCDTRSYMELGRSYENPPQYNGSPPGGHSPGSGNSPLASNPSLPVSAQQLSPLPPLSQSTRPGNRNTENEGRGKGEMTGEPVPRNGATLRERTRMHMLNDAFDDLRKVVPKSNLSEHQKLSKIATLRLAIHYISALVSILKSTGAEIELTLDETSCGDRRGRKRGCRRGRDSMKASHGVAKALRKDEQGVYPASRNGAYENHPMVANGLQVSEGMPMHNMTYYKNNQA